MEEPTEAAYDGMPKAAIESEMVQSFQVGRTKSCGHAQLIKTKKIKYLLDLISPGGAGRN